MTMTARQERRIDAAMIVMVIAAVVITIIVLMPNRQPHPRQLRCANGATPNTWITVDGDGQRTTNLQCAP